MQRLVQDVLAYSRVGNKGKELLKTSGGLGLKGADDHFLDRVSSQSRYTERATSRLRRKTQSFLVFQQTARGNITTRAKRTRILVAHSKGVVPSL
jgi:hypothetical protein